MARAVQYTSGMQPMGKTKIQHGAAKQRCKREKGERRAQTSGARNRAKAAAKQEARNAR